MTTNYRGHVLEFLNGDGTTTTFALRQPIVDLIHDRDDPFCDRGIYRSDPKVEYPLGRRRWAISHTYLAYPITDAALYDKEYTWDRRTNTLTTHFHEHVPLERAFTDETGWHVRVAQTPIATGVYVRANRFTGRGTSAVRGVWDNPEKRGRNYYIRRACILTGPQLLCYVRAQHEPIVNQLGLWEVEDGEEPERFFNEQGRCTSTERVMEELRIPLHQPKILVGECQMQPSDVGMVDFEAPRNLPGATVPANNLQAVPPPDYLKPWQGSAFEPGRVGFAATESLQQQRRVTGHGATAGYQGFRDVNGDGRIDQWETAFLRQHQGETWRVNVGDWGYFGVGWLSAGMGSAITKEKPYRRYIAAYEYGGGYDAEAGVIHLLDSPGAKREVFVEYHYDAPAAAGRGNILVYLHI